MSDYTKKRECSCAFTGHRMEKLPWGANEQDERCLELKERLAAAVEVAYEEGKRHFLCGMATGCDMYFCEAVMELRQAHEDVTLEAVIPCETQSDSWSAPLRKRYFRLASECDYQTIVQKEFTPDCMMRRNRYMVDNASLLIACYNGRAGGTQSTMLYAIRQKVEIIEIPIVE